MLPTPMHHHWLDHPFPQVSVVHAQFIFSLWIVPHLGKRRVAQILWYSPVVFVQTQSFKGFLQQNNFVNTTD